MYRVHAVIFDIDGTLVDSNDVDGRCYKEALIEELGPVQFREDWSRYPHVTDQGCLIDVLKDNEIVYSPSHVERVKDRFFAKIRAHAREQGFHAMEGAVDFFQTLRNSPSFRLALATGAWRKSALIKLASASIEHAGVPLFASDDHHSRVEVMRLAHDALGNGLDGVTYYGDAPWDGLAVAALGWHFEAVGSSLNGLKSYDGELDRLTRRCRQVPEISHR